MKSEGFKNVLVAVDNSPASDACCEAAVSLASVFGARVVGCHVHAARMHEKRFRQMESTLPGEYLTDKELERQRTIHDSLIALGLQLISNCYLDALEGYCRRAEVPFQRKTLEGKNWERVVEEIETSNYDLVVMGARGHGVTRPDTIGSVCMRVLRRIRTDALIIRDPSAFKDGHGKSIVVALDGSQEAFGALRVAVALGKAYSRSVEAVAAYDPYFHYAIFHSMVKALSEEAAKVFRFKEQERLHEEIIDTGLARLYHDHLEVAERIAAAQGVKLTTTLMDGRPADELLAYVERTRPWLLCLGRVGVHSGEGMDIGSVTEHLLRLAPCNLFIGSRRFNPPREVWAQSTLQWTREAEAVLGHMPEGYKGSLRLLVHRLALEKGHSVITARLVGEAMESIKPGSAGTSGMETAALAVAVEALRREPGMVYLCQRCGHAVRQQRPVNCPVCQTNGETFWAMDIKELEKAAHSQGGVSSEEAFDGGIVRWSREAAEQLEHISDPQRRNRVRLRIEKDARLKKLSVITSAFALRHLEALEAGKQGRRFANRSEEHK